MIDWLEVKKDHNGDDAYTLDSAKKFEVIELAGNGYLVLRYEMDKFIINFAVLDFVSCEPNNSNTLLRNVFHGSGCGGNLRECRHTWWGDEHSYIFYPNGKLIADAFQKLSKYFDEMVANEI